MLIAFDGIDGSGKSTALVSVAKRLIDSGHKLTILKEPSTGPYGLRFRKLAKKPLSPLLANSILMQDRAWDVRHNITPALRRSDLVLLDRYFYSHVNQANSVQTAHEIINLNRKRFPIPKIAFIFDLSPLVAKQRICSSRPHVELLERRLAVSRSFYKSLSCYSEIIRINASAQPEVVSNLVFRRIDALMQRRSWRYDN